MKKILIVLLSLFLITGCGSESIHLDLEKVEIELNNLEYVENGTTTKLFEQNKKLDTEEIDGRNIDTNNFDEILFSISTLVNNYSMYIVYLPKSGKEDECESMINDYIDSLKVNADSYNPEGAKMLKNYTLEKYGNYYIYVVSKDNDSVIEKIKNTK